MDDVGSGQCYTAFWAYNVPSNHPNFFANSAIGFATSGPPRECLPVLLNQEGIWESCRISHSRQNKQGVGLNNKTQAVMQSTWIWWHWHIPSRGTAGGEAVDTVSKELWMIWGDIISYIALAWSRIVHVVLGWERTMKVCSRGPLLGLRDLLWEGGRHVKLPRVRRHLQKRFSPLTLWCLQSSPAWTSWWACHVKSWAKQLEASKRCQRYGQYRDTIL